MSHRSMGSDATSGHIKASQPAARAFMRQNVRASVSKAVSNTVSTTQQRLTVLGVSAIALVAMFSFNSEVTMSSSVAKQPVIQQAPQQATAPVVAATRQAAPALPAPPSQAELAFAGTKRQQQAVTSWLSKRYRVAGGAADMLVSTAYTTAKEIKLDPLLILAVMAIESGLNPFAESPVGAKGLMQVMADIHHAKFQAMGGPQMALNPTANIRVGSAILKDYVTRGGSVEAGLKSYVGAGAFDTDSGYGSRVLAELQKLKMVASGKHVPTYITRSAPAQVAVPKAATPKHEAEPMQIAPQTEAPQEAIAGL